MKQTRTSRKNTTNGKEPKNQSEKVYYIIIAVLLVVLLGIVFYILANRDSAVTIDEGNLEPETEIAVNSDEDDEEADDQNTESVEETEETTEDSSEQTEDEDESDQDEQTEDEATEEDTTDEESETDESTEAEAEESTEDESEETTASVNDNAPLDESYVPNYSSGSSDRVAISNAVTSVTSLNGSDMITWWVGNNGPGRVFTVVSNTAQTDVYRVNLQYGEGQWHVTGVQELSDVPSEYR